MVVQLALYVATCTCILLSFSADRAAAMRNHHNHNHSGTNHVRVPSVNLVVPEGVGGNDHPVDEGAVENTTRWRADTVYLTNIYLKLYGE